MNTNDQAPNPTANNSNNNYNSVYDKQKNYQLSPSSASNTTTNNNQQHQHQQQALANDLTQIKYLKNNYNIQYYPSDFVNFSQQASEAISPNSSNKHSTDATNSTAQQQRQSNQKPTRSSDFLINQLSPSSKPKATNPNLLLATATKPNSNSSTTSTSSTSSTSSKLLGSNVQNAHIQEELSTSKSQRTSLKLSKLTSGLNGSNITSPTSETNEASSSRFNADNFHQQVAELQSNLKSVKSLTNLYESKQLSVSPPTTSPIGSTNGAPQTY